ncbi:MAG: alpha/beta fold hydrolase [Gemmataceae bacterium]|nr:alpha/beta fold hydrolase [Gemmataceae bacterium]MDW8265335.1 alpha/beta fold hydrolase [Gemmataceae bacterium]
MPFLGNRHLQTILGNAFGTAGLNCPTEERLVHLPDGDCLVLHDGWPRGWRPGRPVALLVHGLGGSHRSAGVTRMARRLSARGIRVVRIDLRGSGRGLALARRLYHGGCSDDLRVAVEAVHAGAPSSPIFVIGFSLGGNIALKLAGEAAAHPVSGLARVAAISPPIDFERCADLIALPANRFYERRFVRALVRLVRRRQHLRTDVPVIRFPPATTLRLFDELYTAPSHGFADAADYYRRASSAPWLERIRVPTLILAARDDPLVPGESFAAIKPTETLRVCLVERGGHLGFLGWDGAGGVRWAEQRVADWVLGPID